MLDLECIALKERETVHRCSRWDFGPGETAVPPQPELRPLQLNGIGVFSKAAPRTQIVRVVYSTPSSTINIQIILPSPYTFNY
jgi:hypothetical protein